MNCLRGQIDDAIAGFEKALAENPECRRDVADDAWLDGRLREHACFYLGRQPDTSQGEGRPAGIPPVLSAEERLLKYLEGAANPVEMLNPFEPVRHLGKGTGTLAASFGIQLNPELNFTPEGCRPLADVLAEGVPDAVCSGILPEMLEDIETTKALTPAWQKIALPDMQGPFNIAHMVLGDDAFIAPMMQPDEWREFMDIVTTFFIEVHRNLSRWIGPERLFVRPWRYHRIAECSVNMVSKDFYLEHILDYDRKIAEYYGDVAVHPCSGPHVFHATLENLPRVVYTEAGNMINKMTAGSIQVKDAIEAIGDRPILLRIGEELPAGQEEEVLRQIIDLVAERPHVSLGGFTGLGWKKGDEPSMLDLHKRVNDYYQNAVS